MRGERDLQMQRDETVYDFQRVEVVVLRWIVHYFTSSSHAFRTPSVTWNCGFAYDGVFKIN